MDTVEEYRGCGRYVATLQPGYVAAGELGIAWLRIMVAHWFRVFRARDTRARRWQVVQWTDNGQPVAAGGALYRQFHRQFFGCSRPSTEEQVRSVGGRRTEPLASSSPAPLLPLSAFLVAVSFDDATHG